MAAYGTDSMGGGSGQGSGNEYQYGQSVEERMRDIQEREQRVLDMERELDEKEQALQKQYKGYRPSKNWPGARCAIARHDISKDIASRYQNHVRKFYSLWWLVVLACCLNWLSVIWYGLFKKETNFMSYVLLPTLYVCVGCPCTWMFWYKRYYRAMQNNGNLSYMFFVFFGMFYSCCIRTVIRKKQKKKKKKKERKIIQNRFIFLFLSFYCFLLFCFNNNNNTTNTNNRITNTMVRSKYNWI